MSRAAERTLAVAGAVALVCSAALLAGPAPYAHANEMTLFSCHTPAGEAVGHAGWQNVRSADEDMVAEDSCAGAGTGVLSLELQANPDGYQNAAQNEWVFTAPPWASVASYALSLAGSYADPSTGGGSGQAFVNASDESDPNYDYRNLGAGKQGAWVIARSPPAPVQSLTLNASCDGQDGPCHTGVQVASLQMKGAVIVLRDGTTPSVSGLSGNLLPGSTIRGAGETDFTASDSGPGIYSAQLILDGAAQSPVLLDSNGGWCENLGQTSDGTRSFAHPDPCMQTVSGAVGLDTTSLADGEHALALSVEDASGNTTTAFNATITTHNAPLSTSPPAIGLSGEPAVGSSLSVSTGAWSAPAGAGPIEYGYQWEDCDSHGQECEPVAGASASDYAPQAADVGHTLRVILTATDRDGASSATSAASASVAASVGADGAEASAATGNGLGASEAAKLHLDQPGALTRGFNQSALTLAGTLNGPGSAPIGGAALDILESSGDGTRLLGHAETSTNGSFTSRIPAGPSRTILIAYRAASSDVGYAASASVRESVSAGVRLLITPRRTSSAGTIVLSGAVLGHVPRSGVIVELLVRYRGAWEPFRTPRSDSRGRFRIAYRFQGATGRFPFRAIVLAGQAGFPYADGHSAIVTVTSG